MRKSSGDTQAGSEAAPGKVQPIRPERVATAPAPEVASAALLTAALPHIETLARSLAAFSCAVRLLDVGGHVLHAAEAPTMPRDAVSERATIHAAPGRPLAVVEVVAPRSVAGGLLPGIVNYVAQSIESDLAQSLRHGERSRAELARQTEGEAAVRLAALVESSEDAIIGKDLDGIVTSWNAAAERMYGYSEPEAVGRHIGFLSPPERASEIDDLMRRLRAGENIKHYETLRRHKDGSIIEVALTISPIRNESGDVIGASTIARDMTEIKRAENTLRQTEKLAATGRLAASIAHEINNPMASVTNLLYLLEHQPALDDNSRRYVTLAQDELRRITHIVRQMLGFYRESDVPVPVNLAEVVDNVLGMYARKIANASVEVLRGYRFGVEIRAFPGEIRQVFSNLIVNALEAIGENGGKLRVNIRPARDWRGTGQKGVRVTIGDTGPGISSSHRRRIFEPFFTTKGERGTGLGLWVTEGIVRKHGGFIRLRSSVQPQRHGTCFSVFLPLQTPTPHAVAGRRRKAK